MHQQAADENGGKTSGGTRAQRRLFQERINIGCCAILVQISSSIAVDSTLILFSGGTFVQFSKSVTMQSPILAALLLLCAAVYSANSYTTKFDNINVDEILANEKLLNFYVQCLLGRKTCNAEGQTLKEILPDALQTRCAKCNDKQKDGALKAIKVLEKKYPEQWKLLLEKWDPTGEYFKAFQAEQEAYFHRH